MRRNVQVDEAGHKFLDRCKAGDQASWDQALQDLMLDPSLANFVGDPSKPRWSALHQAMLQGQEKAIHQITLAILLTGGDVNMKNGAGKTPKEETTSEKCRRIVDNYLTGAALAGRLARSTQGFEKGHAILPGFVQPEGFPDPETAPYANTTVKKPGKEEGENVNIFMLRMFAQLAGFVVETKDRAMFEQIGQLLEAELSSPGDDLRYQNFIQNPDDMTVPRRVQLIMTNPFFSSSMTFQNAQFFKHYGITMGPPPDADVVNLNLLGVGISQGGFVVTCLPPRPGVGPASLFQKFVACMDKNKYLRFCLDIAKAPDAIPATKYFQILPSGGHREVTGLSDEQKECIIDTIGLFYAESLHAALHMFHFAMVGMLRYVSNKMEGHRFYKILADLYEPSVEVKYNQVQRLLIGADDMEGVLTTTMFQSDKEMLTTVMSDFVSDLGTCSGWEEVLEIFYPQIFDGRLSEVTRKGSFEELGLKPDMPAPGLPATLGDLKEQAAEFITEFATQLANLVDPHNEAGKHFQAFCEGTKNSRFRVSSLKQWVELMTITGMIHGTTLSMTKLFFLPQGVSYMNYKPASEELDLAAIPGKYSGSFTDTDFEAMSVALATVVGLEDGQEVFPDLTNAARAGGALEGGRMNGPLLAIFSDFAAKAERNRKERRLKYQRLFGADFQKFGWMFSDYYDHCSPLRRQQTLTTYI